MMETRQYAQEHSMHCMSNLMKKVTDIWYTDYLHQIIVTKDYQNVPVPEDQVDTIYRSYPYENKSQVDEVDTIHSIVYDDQSNNYDDNNHTPSSNEDQYLQETNKILQSSQLKSLQSKFLSLSLLASLQYGFLQSSLLVSLQSTPVHTSTLLLLWNVFLQCLYGDFSNIICIQVKPEIYSYRYSHLYKDISTVTSIHMKPKISKLWILSRLSLQPYMKYFHKLIMYYIIDYNHNNTNNIRR